MKEFYSNYWKLISVISILVLFSFIFKYVNSNKSKPINSIQPQNTEKTIMSELNTEQLTQYYLVYKNPYVLFLRERLNILDKDSKNYDNKTTIEEDGFIEGLPLFMNDLRYKKSKFIVLSYSENRFGGLTINILFQDKPDKVFSAWVYRIVGTEEYELRGFWTTTQKILTQKQIRYYKPLLDDKVHAL